MSLKGTDWNGIDGIVNSMVRSVGFEALRDRALDGPSAASRRISGCLVLRRLRSHHPLLKASRRR